MEELSGNRYNCNTKYNDQDLREEFEMKRHECFTVLGKPFFSVGGQLHNSSSYALGAAGGEKYMQDMATSFASKYRNSFEIFAPNLLQNSYIRRNRT